MSHYDIVEIEDMQYDEGASSYWFPCPCGDKFLLSLEDFEAGEDVARCPSCSLTIKIIRD